MYFKVLAQKMTTIYISTILEKLNIVRISIFC